MSSSMMLSSPRHTNEDSDEDVPQLSAHALSALQEFLKENMTQMIDEEDARESDEVKHVSENWQLSQFWYTEETALYLAKKTLSVAGENSKIACISCPTLYKKLREMLPDSSRAFVFEYDERFSKWGDDFIFYDYNEAEIRDLPEDFKKGFDVIVCDPPFLRQDCVSQIFQHASNILAKDGLDTPIIFCTGLIMEDLLNELGKGKLKRTDFTPEHSSKLSNPFMLMTNFE